ncbi:MAG: hypothetical protein NT095_08740 [Burkholderiales bacterium]|nr:hypothetical protein [Burkholderiales bacterium]
MPTISMFYGILVSMEIHAEELMADWSLAIEGRELFRIDPLK